MIKPAIVVVGYNRPEGVKRLLDSIGKATYKAHNIPLIISIDESNRSDEVESVARSFEWIYGTKEIIRFPERQGLRKHIIKCGDHSIKYGAVIILEDDLVVAKDFYNYVCECHEAYSNDSRVCGVSLYSFGANQFTHFPFIPKNSLSDVYAGSMVVTWGQSWTSSQWNRFKEWFKEHYERLPQVNYRIPRDISTWRRSWGIYFANYMADNNLKYIYPYISRTTCFSDYGEHNKSSIPLSFVQVPLREGIPQMYNFEIYDDLVSYDAFYEYELNSDFIVEGISSKDICVDLNNMKHDTDGKNYLLSNAKLKFEIITSFGLTLKPLICNVEQSISGNEIYLYKIGPDEIIRKWNKTNRHTKENLIRLKYEYQDIHWKKLLYYAPRELFFRLKDFISKK